MQPMEMFLPCLLTRLFEVNFQIFIVFSSALGSHNWSHSWPFGSNQRSTYWKSESILFLLCLNPYLQLQKAH